MNPYEEKLTQFLDDEVMYNAVKNILEAQFDMNSLKTDFGTENEVLGQMTKAHLYGKKLLDAGFKELQKYKRQKDEPHDDTNPAL